MGFIDKFPIGAAFGKGLTLRMGQTHIHKYLRPLLERIEGGEIEPSFVITHRLRLEDAPLAYKIFHAKQDGCIKVVLDPWRPVSAISRIQAADKALAENTTSESDQIV